MGNDIANELVERFNKVDATYRAELRELNELNYARFEASMFAFWIGTLAPLAGLIILLTR